jgi:hypothetical protein
MNFRNDIVESLAIPVYEWCHISLIEDEVEEVTNEGKEYEFSII